VQYATPDGTRRWTLSSGGRDESAVSPADMSQEATLEDFLQWGMRTLPARHYVVVLGGHGAGFIGGVTDVGRGHLMPVSAAGSALASMHPDVLVYNACLMSQAEVAAEVLPHADYLVAAEGLEDREGMPLGVVAEGLSDARDGAAAARLVADASARTPARVVGPSAVDLRAMPAVVDALDALGTRILAAPAARDTLRAHVRALPSFTPDTPWDRPLSDYRDLDGWARRLADDRSLEPSGIAAAARDLRDALGTAVLRGGLSAWLPLAPIGDTHGEPGRAVQATYDGLALSRATRWDEAVRSVSG